jgi:two-component system, NtrC family, response regulator GlrR
VASSFAELERTQTERRKKTLQRRRYRLTVEDGPSAGAHVDFDTGLRLGSRQLADFVIADRKVSGLHCEIAIEDAVRVRDLASKNGCFIDRVRVFDAILPPGGKLGIGDSRLRIEPLDEIIEIELHPDDEFHGIVGGSAAIRSLTSRLAQLAPATTTVVVTGETGSGKEGVAHALHAAGPRRDGPFVVLDCGAIPPNLIEAELFGYERGAFTGAEARRQGAFEQAHGGTLFLDEIGELPLALQPRLLRALESRRVRRLGGSEDVAVDVRVVAATHRDLAREAAEGRFREDLYHRLAVVVLRIPPLRERPEDIFSLSVHFLTELGVKPASILNREALTHLERHAWPGNVRELRNTLERAVVLARPPQIDNGLDRSDPGDEGGSLSPLSVDLSVPLREGKQRLIERYERAYVTSLMAKHRGRIKEAARQAGIDRVSLYRILQRLSPKD